MYHTSCECETNHPAHYCPSYFITYETLLQHCHSRYPASSLVPAGLTVLLQASRTMAGHLADPNTSLSKTMLCLHPDSVLMHKMTTEGKAAQQ